VTAEVLVDDGPARPALDWTWPDAPERFAAHAAALAAAAGPDPHRWVTWRRANAAAARACLLRRRPGRRRLDVASLVRSLDHLLAGHVLAAAAIGSARPGEVVAVDIAHPPVYELGALLADLLAAPAEGVARHDLGPWLAARRAAFDAAVRPPAGPAGPALRAWSAGLIAGERALPRAVAALYGLPGA